VRIALGLSSSSSLSLLLLAGCSAPAVPHPAPANQSTAKLGPHATDEGLRGFEDGQPITKAALEGWVPNSDVIEHVPGYFVFVPHGVRLPREELDSVIPKGAIAVIDNRSPYFPHMSVMRPGVTNMFPIEVGMTLDEAKRRVPALECEGQQPLCAVPRSRIHYVTENGRIDWWVWSGSGRPRAVYRAPVAEWRFEAGGIGPIDGKTPPTVEAIAKLAPGLTVAAEGTDAITLSRNGRLVVRFEVLRGRELLRMNTTTPEIATRAGLRVGDTLRDFMKRTEGTCYYAVKDKLAIIECGDRGVRYWLASRPATQADITRSEEGPSVQPDVNVEGAQRIERIETEVY
jgi:hypothetical protein